MFFWSQPRTDYSVKFAPITEAVPRVSNSVIGFVDCLVFSNPAASEAITVNDKFPENAVSVVTKNSNACVVCAFSFVRVTIALF